MTLPPRLAAFGNFVESSVAPPDLPPHADRHAVGVVQAGARPRPPLPADRVTVVPPGIDPQFTPGRREVARAARRRGRPARPGEALRPADRRAGRAEAAPSGAPRGDRRARATRGPSSRRRSAPRAPKTGSAFPAASTTTTLVDLYRRAWVLASTSAREGWGMTVTEAAACGTPAVVTRIPGTSTRSSRGARGCSPTPATSSPRARRGALRLRPARRLGSARARARGPLHLGRDGPRHPRGARRRPRSGAARARDRRRSPRAPDAREPDGRRGHRARLVCGSSGTRRSPRSRTSRCCSPRRARSPPTPRVPLPRPGPAPGARAVDVGPEHRARHRHPPEHRVPVPDGPVLLGHPLRRGAGLGLAAPLARQHPDVRGARRALPVPHAARARTRRRRRGARVHALAVHARLRGAHLGDPAAVGRAAGMLALVVIRRSATTAGSIPRSSRSSCRSSAA